MATVTLRPERHVAGGDALARDADGRVVFVRGALAGETVTVEIVESKRDFARAEVVAVVEPSPHRVEPPCPQRVAGCGGCDWQHLAAGAQLAAKRLVVVDALRRTAKLDDPTVAAGASVPSTGYRTTVRVVGTADGTAGFRHERSHDTVTAAGCLVAHPRLADLLATAHITPGLEVTLRCSTSSPERTARWDTRGGTVEGLPADVATGADAAVHQAVGRANLRVSSRSFFQSGPDAAALLADAVARAAPELAGARHVADLYGGVGLLAAVAVPDHVAITLVESDRSAVADARVNVPRARVVPVDVGRWRPRADDGSRLPIDVVIADPPRTGLGAPGVAAVVSSRASTVVLVSCDPAAAARDTRMLGEHGYRHDRTEVLDLFPLTHHVETVTRFTRATLGGDAG